jgi:hypothetical protein
MLQVDQSVLQQAPHSAQNPTYISRMADQIPHPTPRDAQPSAGSRCQGSMLMQMMKGSHCCILLNETFLYHLRSMEITQKVTLIYIVTRS